MKLLNKRKINEISLRIEFKSLLEYNKKGEKCSKRTLQKY